MTRKSESPGFTSRCDARGARGDHAGERRHDSGQVVVALRLPERELGLAVLELDLLRIGPGDHAGRRERPLPLEPAAWRWRACSLRLGECDLLVGALEPGEQLAGRHAAADVRQDATRPCPTSARDRGVVLDVELRGQR